MPQSTAGLPIIVKPPAGLRPAWNATALHMANLAAWHARQIGSTGMLAAAPESGSMQPLGTIGNPLWAQRRPWLEEPPGSVPFDEQGAIDLPLQFNNVVNTVVTLVVPQGFDGVVQWISNVVQDGTFTIGDLVWSIQINGRPARNFGDIIVQKGTPAQGREISPLHLFSGDVVTYVVMQTGGSPTGMTVCSLTGYYYPSKGIS